MRAIESSISGLVNPYTANRKSREKMTQSFEGWMGYASYANTYGLRTKVAKLFDSAFRERQRSGMKTK